MKVIIRIKNHEKMENECEKANALTDYLSQGTQNLNPNNADLSDALADYFSQGVQDDIHNDADILSQEDACSSEDINDLAFMAWLNWAKYAAKVSAFVAKNVYWKAVLYCPEYQDFQVVPIPLNNTDLPKGTFDIQGKDLPYKNWETLFFKADNNPNAKFRILLEDAMKNYSHMLSSQMISKAITPSEVIAQILKFKFGYVPLVRVDSLADEYQLEKTAEDLTYMRRHDNLPIKKCAVCGQYFCEEKELPVPVCPNCYSYADRKTDSAEHFRENCKS